MFTDRFNQMLMKKQISAYKVAKETGISQGLMNEYKKRRETSLYSKFD